jgi:hypothetical protein
MRITSSRKLVDPNSKKPVSEILPRPENLNPLALFPKFLETLPA